MAYTLLYSRNITSDDRARFTDVPIESSSIMIDILSLRSPYYRIAGYAYSIVSDGLIDYERGTGYTLPFGKNRLLFPNTVLPYYLEFFPKWGTKQAIISVYTGSASAPPPPGSWKQAPAGPYQMKLNVSPFGASYRTDSFSEYLDSVMNGAVEAVMTGDYVFWKLADGTVNYKPIGPDSFFAIGSESDYQNKVLNPASVVL